MSYVSFCVADEWELTGAKTASISSVVFLGSTVGNVLFGHLADKYGRRNAYICGTYISNYLFLCSYHFNETVPQEVCY